MDVHGETVGKLSQVTAGPDGAVTALQYTDAMGMTQPIDPRNLSYSGGDVAVLIE
jgi:hypothetical protein